MQAAADKLREDAAVDLIIGNNRKADLVPLLDAWFAGKEIKESITDLAGSNEYEKLTFKKQAEHTRAFIKVQDGCNQFCSYCIIPYTRGRVRSRRPEDVEEEVKILAEEGYKEIVLTGIHLTSYGIDFKDEGIDFLTLIKTAACDRWDRADPLRLPGTACDHGERSRRSFQSFRRSARISTSLYRADAMTP